MIDAIDRSYSIGMDFSETVLRRKAAEFAQIAPHSAGVFNGVVMAIDGWVMVTRQPFEYEIPSISCINAFRRQEMTNTLDNVGVLRPQRSQHQSRA